MKRFLFFSILILTIINIVLPQGESAVPFLLISPGAAAGGRGETGVALADDATAIFWNPAGLAQLQSSEIHDDLYHLRFANQSTFKGNTILENRNFTKFKSLGFAYKFPTTQGNLVIAFGYNRIKDYDDFLYFSGYNRQSNNLEIPIVNQDNEVDYYIFENNVLQTEEISQDGNLGTWSIGGGVMLSPNFSKPVCELAL